MRSAILFNKNTNFYVWSRKWLLRSVFLQNNSDKVEAGNMRQVVLWDTACNFNATILNQSIFNCLITSASTLSTLLLEYNV